MAQMSATLGLHSTEPLPGKSKWCRSKVDSHSTTGSRSQGRLWWDSAGSVPGIELGQDCWSGSGGIRPSAL